MSWMDRLGKLVPNASAFNDAMIVDNGLYKKERWNDTIRHLRDVIKKYPDEAEGHGFLGRCLVIQQRYVEAEAELRIANRIKPSHAGYSIYLAHSISKQGRNEEALTHLERALEIHLTNRDLIAAYSETLAAADFIDDGVKNLLKAHNHRNTSADRDSTLGFCLMQAKRFQEAIPVFRRLLNIDPANIDARQNLAICLYSLGQRDQACSELLIATKVSPEDLSILTLVASSLHSWRRYELAGRVFAQCLRLEPDMEINLSILGMNLKRQGHLTQATKAFQSILPNEPKTFSEQNERAIALFHLGKNEEAIAQYQQAAEMSGVLSYLAVADNNIALVHETAGRYQEAEKHYLRAMTDDDLKLSCRAGLGNVYLAMDRLDEAEDMFRSALEEEPYTTEAWLGLGRLFNRKGNRASAINYIQTGLEYEPSHADSKAELSCLD